ncbi:MAG: peroxiredoxin [Dehalococcoidia bacterium]|nr:peroxiredoxin [Dehalococcoidia bacterium]
MVGRKTVLQKGEPAPDFILKDQDGKEFRLSDLIGRRALLSFHPLAWTGVCAKQMQSLEDNISIFESLNTVPVGINVDSVPTKKAWALELGIKKVRLLSDFWPHGGVARLYGLFREKDGFSERANLIVDENGKVIFSKVYELGELPDIQEITELLKAL